MQKLGHILVPTDFGEPAARALEMGVALARKFDGKLTLLHVHWIPTTYGYGEGLYWPVEELGRAAQAALGEALAKLKEQLPSAEGILADGNPSERILAVAKERGADLIVMGTHGRRGLSHALLGSVAEKVVRRSPVPVLIVGAGADQTAS